MIRNLKTTTVLPIALLLFSAEHPVPSMAAAAQTDGKFRRNEITLHYTIFGDGPPVLLLSGGPGFSVDPLISTAKELANSHKCILFEQRGTGKSQVSTLNSSSINLKEYIDDLEGLRAHLGIKTWTILGLSWGGMLAMAYAASHPDAVHALVLVGSGGINLDYSKRLIANRNARMLPSEREAIEYWGNASRVASDPDRAGLEVTRALLPSYFYDRKKANAMIQSLRPGVFNLRVNSLMDADLEKIEYDLRPALRNFKRPVLALYGRQDPIGEETALQIHHALSNSILEYIEECGHVPMVEQPEAYFRVVRSFLDKYR